MKDAVLRQRTWSDAELRAAGFRRWRPRKRLVMARELQEALTIDSAVGPLRALPGDMLCYRPDDAENAPLAELERWPVRRDVFARNYRPWDEALPPVTSLAALQEAGCRPWYKAGAVWAQRLTEARRVQSPESPQPVTAAAGEWLLIGLAGEPWHMDDAAFHSRYVRAED